MYTIKHAAQVVGVSEATLRAWERRHGIGTSTRSDAGYRLYDEHAIQTLRTTKTLVDEGWSVALAAAEARRRHETDTPADPAALTRPSAFASTEELVPYAESFDARGLDTLLDRRFARGSFEHLADNWLLPALEQVGLAWEEGRISVAGEHFVAHAVSRRLSASYDAAGASLTGAQVAIGLAPGCHHDLGLLCFATAARRAGIATRYLGADVPLDDWASAVRAPGTAAAVIAIPMAEDLAPTARTVDTLREAQPSILVAVGGAQQDHAPEGVVRLGHRIGPAAHSLATLLSSTPRTG